MGKPKPVACNVCGRMINRKADLSRHHQVHALNKEELMHRCSVPGCNYKTLQFSNFKIHVNKHSGNRPYNCPEEGCPFDTADPASLTRHRKRLHNYQPKASSHLNHGSATSRQNSRQQRRSAPYPTSLLVKASTSTPSLDRIPLPQLPGMLDESILPMLTTPVENGNGAMNHPTQDDLKRLANVAEPSIVSNQLTATRAASPVPGLLLSPGQPNSGFSQQSPLQQNGFFDPVSQQTQQLSVGLGSSDIDTLMQINNSVDPLKSMQMTFGDSPFVPGNADKFDFSSWLHDDAFDWPTLVEKQGRAMTESSKCSARGLSDEQTPLPLLPPYPYANQQAKMVDEPVNYFKQVLLDEDATRLPWVPPSDLAQQSIGQ